MAKVPKKMIKTASDKAAVKSGCYFDNDAADRAVEFFKRYLRHSKGEWAGQRFKLADWQEGIIRSLFGWMRPDNTRRFREAFISVARKNGKTTLASGVAALLLFDDEPGAHVFAAAAAKDQAKLCFDETKAMFEMSPDILKHSEIYRNEIRVPRTRSFFRVISADARLQHGLNVHGCVIDELHAHKDRYLYDVIKTSCGSRRQPLIFIITTAGHDQSSICYEVDTYAQKVLNGSIIDESFFAYIARAPEDAEWTKEDTWKQANPNYGISIKPDYLREEAEKAKHVPAYQNTFRQLHLNQWTQQATRWIDLTLWDENGIKIDIQDFVNRPCYCGLDIGSVSDMTAWAMLFPDENGRVDILCRFWTPEARLHDTSNKYRDQYQVWARQGYLTTTPGDATDYATIREQIIQDCEEFDVQSISTDKYFQGGQFIQDLVSEGLPAYEARLGFITYGYLTAEFTRLLLERKLNHGNHPVLRWNADNVTVKVDPAGNHKPDKATSQGKIDGIVAILLGLDRLIRREPPKRSIYEDRGFLFLDSQRGDQQASVDAQR